MSFNTQVFTDVRTYYAGLDLTGFSNKVNIDSEVDELDKTTFASGGWKEKVGGLHDTSASVDAFWQAGDLSYPDDTFWANLGSSTNPLTIVPTSGAVGSLAYLTKALEHQYKLGGDDGKLATASLAAKGNWPLARGTILHAQGTARTATGNGAATQLGALTSAQALYATVHVLSIAGTATPTITVKIQSNTDNTFGSPTDRITFTAATALSGEALSVAGAVTDQWWRVTWTITGTNPSFLFAVAAGIANK